MDAERKPKRVPVESSAVASALQGSVLKPGGRSKRVGPRGAQGLTGCAGTGAQELEALSRTSCAFRTQEWEKLIEMRAWLESTLLRERRMRAPVSTNLVLQVAVRLLGRNPEVVEAALTILAEDLRRNVPKGAQGEPAVSSAPAAAASSLRAAGHGSG